jgi:hypothetical protein
MLGAPGPKLASSPVSSRTSASSTKACRAEAQVLAQQAQALNTTRPVAERSGAGRHGQTFVMEARDAPDRQTGGVATAAVTVD